jgi:hypothetical protein
MQIELSSARRESRQFLESLALQEVRRFKGMRRRRKSILIISSVTSCSVMSCLGRMPFREIRSGGSELNLYRASVAVFVRWMQKHLDFAGILKKSIRTSNSLTYRSFTKIREAQPLS